ncbi:MAG: hypothetical protein ACXAEN_27250 [Candidatus Thorarchaeota archaeon]|jgi:hypothetical protein
MEEYLEEAKELGLVLYQPCHEYDTALLQWWIHLNETDTFTEVFAESQRSLSKFFRIFEPPNLVVLAFEDNKIWMVVWFTPFGDSPTAATVSYWCREDKRGEDKRGARKQLKVTKLLYTMAFNFWDVLLGVTRHEHLLRIHRKLGYNIVGSIPHLMSGESAWVVYLTKENFENSRMYKLGES